MTNDLDGLFQGQKADIFYSDPPWGAGNLNFWRTYNNQKGHPTSWNEFVHRIKFLAYRHTKGTKFIETGLRFEQDIIDVFGKPTARYVIKYKAGGKILDNLLLVYGERPLQDPTGKTGFDVPYTAISSLPTQPKSVFDCCVGLGTTAKVAKKLGLICYANELNPNRVAKTMKILDFTVMGKD
jgi:hypothetical protein